MAPTVECGGHQPVPCDPARGELPLLSLHCHPATTCQAVKSLQASLLRTDDGGLHLRYILTGDVPRLRIPAPQTPTRTDGLWEHTCFEAFIRVQGESAYREFNFSPSCQWAAYAFRDYRELTPWTSSAAPQIRVTLSQGQLVLDARIPATDLPPNPAAQPLHCGFSGVIEAADGSKSYWALVHPTAHPDFHHLDGFAVALR